MLVGVGELGDVGHQATVGTPGVVVCGLTHFGLHLGVVHDHIGPGHRGREGIKPSLYAPGLMPGPFVSLGVGLVYSYTLAIPSYP